MVPEERNGTVLKDFYYLPIDEVKTLVSDPIGNAEMTMYIEWECQTLPIASVDFNDTREHEGKTYALAETDEARFLKKLVKKSNMAKGEYQRKGFAYALSKNFVVWYAKKCAFEYGPRGIRVVSLSPGLIATDMGNLEKEDGAMLIPLTAEERMGRPEELGFAIATVADERNGYLAGVDILCDGGSVSGKKFKKKKK